MEAKVDKDRKVKLPLYLDGENVAGKVGFVFIRVMLFRFMFMLI